MMRDTIPVVLPHHHGRVFTDGNYKQVSQDKDLAEIIKEQALPLRRLGHSLLDEPARIEEVTDSMSIEPPTPASSVVSAQQIDLEMKSHKTTSSEALPASQVTISDVPQMLHFKPNTTYLFCQNVSQILPPTTSESMTQEELHSNVPPQITFIIPPDSFGGAPTIGNSGSKTSGDRTEKSMWNYSDTPSPYFILDVHASPHSPSEKSAFLEVTCSVVDMNFVPVSPPGMEGSHGNH